jgi:heptosyltransferase-2
MENEIASPVTAPSVKATQRRILVRGVNWLGDAVMTTPALQRLREKFPESEITLLSHAKLADLWVGHPSLNRVVTFTGADGLWSVAQRLRQDRFDTALLLPNSPRSALEVWLARIPQRIGYARPWVNWALTQAVPRRGDHRPMRKRSVNEIKRAIAQPSARAESSSPGSHQVHEYLFLAGVLGASMALMPPLLNVTNAEIATATHRFGLPLVSAQPHRHTHPLFGLNPGAEYGAAKRWPAERFISAAAELQRRTHCRWLIFGGPGDAALAAEITDGIRRLQEEFTHHSSAIDPPLNLAGKTSLRELCALLKACRVLLTNDTGPMHVAAALGTPVVVPFGSTSPELTGPGLPGETRHRLLRAGAPCSPCFRRSCPIDFRCMTGITVDQVIEAVLEVASSAQ